LVKKKLPVRWSPKAEQRLNGIYDYIAQDSVSAARYVKKSLIQLGGTLGHFPEKYSKEEYLAKVPGNFRSVSKWRYKLIYEVTEEYVNIINVFNTDQHPSKIKRDR
jgi:plasmid stabilization system protein ParE